MPRPTPPLRRRQWIPRLAPVAALAAMGAAVGAAVWLAAAPAAAQSGLPVPRFVTLGTDEANLRTGPGRRYPVEWVFVRRGMPVEVVAEFDTWRRIRDWEGVEGWVHQSLLSGRRGLIVTGEDLASLWAEPREGAALVARVEPGVVGRLRRCPPPDAPHRNWCWVEVSGFRGWMTRDRIWGAYEGEAVD